MTMGKLENLACVILAGGRGKRMASTDLHKVCFPIAGKPAISRAIDTYKKAGVKRFVVVVGQMAEQVISTVAQEHPEVSFVFQTKPRGTGHAALVAVDALEAQGHNGPVMIVMGDKVTTTPVVRSFLQQYEQSNPDVLMTTLAKDSETTAGRVVLGDKSQVLGIVEKADIDQARKNRKRIKLQGKTFTACQIEDRSPSINASMYLFGFSALHDALHKLESNNAQGELYLTDTVGQIVKSGRVEPWQLDDSTDLMAFNTPAELMEIERVVQSREKPPRVSLAEKKKLSGKVYKTAEQWLKMLQADSPKLKRIMKQIYGKDTALIAERREAMINLAKAFGQKWGKKREMILVRAPGRINLMGRHVDHRGGYVNVMAISREILVAAAARDDDTVTLENLRAELFPSREFRISDLLKEATWSDWIDFVNSMTVQRVLESARGDWSHYARSPLLRLQHECRDVTLKGMDCMVSGNIPRGAGLSSSSSLVVAFAQVAVALNGLDVDTRDFVDLCGEGEWFVGSRGGAADHAAISTGHLGAVSRIGFHPFRLEGEVPFPADLRLVIAYSGAKAVKSDGARDVFNQRVACYELAQRYLQKHWPPAAGIEHLRDLTPSRLQLDQGEIYRALMLLPGSCTRTDLRKIFGPEDAEWLDGLFSSHRSVGKYDLRGAALFGISEIVRSERFADVVSQGDWQRVGRMMRSSHNGDRVVWTDKAGKRRKYLVQTDDTVLEHLAATEVDLTFQCGRYACSTEAIDTMVDIANATPGVIGAQLAGAGLGGCMMVLVRAEALDDLLNSLDTEFYKPNGIEFGAHVVTPVSGAGLLDL